ncbi:MAG: lamin tail domain-containing protein [Gracilimonas sp.]
MHKPLLIIIILILSPVALIFSQTVNFEDGFSDQDISDWSGDNADFTFTDESGNILLQQDAPDAGTSYLSIPSSSVEGYWEFYIDLDFSPSNNNRSFIYLMSDIQDLAGTVNGYRLQAGENLGDDVFRLFRVTDGANDGEVLTGTTNISSGGQYRVKVTRYPSGNWTLEVGEGYAGVLSQEDTGTDNTYASTSHFGFLNTYTSSNTDGFAFDFKIDIPPVEVNSVSAVNENDIDVAFSRAIDFGSVQTSDFSLNPGDINPVTVTEIATDTARISFNDPIPSGQNELTISEIEDTAGETTLADTTFPFVVFDEYQPGDIVINEFLKDPPTGTTQEYIELYNTSDRYLNLKDWQLGDDTNLSSIASSDIAILPDSFLVITSDTAALRNIFGGGNYIQASFPALNNTGDQVRLLDDSGELADSLEYTNDWGGVDVALERLDPSVSATFIENWGDSPASNFGTPGFTNLVETDVTPPEIATIERTTGDQIQLTFSERLQETPAETISNFILSADNLSEAIPDLQSASFVSPSSITLQYDTDLPSEPEGTTYELSIANQTDIFGNYAADITSSFFVIDYAVADSGDTFITEFMYNPATGFTDFIEIYNPSENAFNIQGWTYNDNSGNRRVISDDEFTLPPDSRIILAPDSTIAESFPDITLISLGSRFANLNSTTSDDIVIRNQNGTIIDSLTYEPNWGGSEVSLERRSIDFPSIFKENWGDSPSNNLATSGATNEIQPDTNPPEIASFEVLNDSTFQVIFTERIQSASAEDESNYSLNEPKGLPSSPPALESVQFSAPDTVIVYFTSALPKEDQGSEYTLTIDNQSDIFGNTEASLVAAFFVIDIALATSGEVVISEFMYDPGPGFSEFVELHNTTDKNFDLQGWTFNDNTGTRRIITDSNYELVTGSYLILAPDSTIIDIFPDRPIIVMGNRFSSLNNGSDDIVIRNNDGALIDSLTYDSDWGGNEVSLERRSPNASSFYSENWGDSPSPDFATPGEENQIQPDNNPPEIANAFIIAADSIRIIFDERVDSVQAKTTSNYSLTPSVSVSQVTDFSGNALILVLGTSFSDGESYTLTIENQEDIFGNLLTSTSAELEYTEFTPAGEGDVILNEILYRRASADSEEFIELYNRTDRNFNLSNWILQDATSSTSIPEGTEIRSGEYLILTDLESFAGEISNGVYLSGFPSLNDEEDAVVIRNQEETLIDSLFYQDTWGGNEPGVALERKDPLSASNDASNWASSNSENGNSAGSQSSTYQPDETAPKILFSKLQSDDTIFVVFSEFVNINNTSAFVNEEPASIIEYDQADGNIVILENPVAASAKAKSLESQPLSLSFTDITDFRGNASDELSVEVSQPVTPGAVVINEILYNPLANSDDNLPDQTEYIELYNPREYAISLEGFLMHDEPDEDNEVRSLFPVSSQYKWIPAGGYVVVYAENEATTFRESQLAEYFELENDDDQFKARIDRTSLSLANSDDSIYLADSTGATIDSVFYDESWQNPNLYDTDGIALERIDPAGPSNDQSNWSSSTRVNGGTPGEQNSIFQEGGTVSGDTGISFTPNPFSPDDDGFDDNLFINYKLDESDYLLRIRIFDRYGRQVKKLADGIQAGFEGSLIWDGLTDDDRRNRVGIYIVLFEAYNSANGRNRTFKETVVLARKF